MPVDAQLKARHCVLMLLAAARLVDCAPEEAQKRALARYVFVFADAGLDWIRIWRNELARVPGQERHAKACKAAVRELAAMLGEGEEIRDYLGAKRQAAAGMRADDIEATLRLWAAVNPPRVKAICKAARCTHDALAGVDDDDSVAIWTFLPDQLAEELEAVLPKRDSAYWHLAADSAAALRPYTLPVEGGGLIGRRVTQINDVAMHLDVLLRIAGVAERHLVYDWLVRSVIGLELSALLDLTLGAPPGAKLNVVYPLLALCRGQGDPKDAESLEQLRESIGEEGWIYLRQFRNTVGAHLDRELSMFAIHRHLIELDYAGVIALAEHVLDFLDAMGAGSPGLGLLVLGERRIGSWPIDPEAEGPGRPKGAMVGSVAGMFRRFDSPYMTVSASSTGSGAVAGIVAGRIPRPRDKAKVMGRAPNRWLEPASQRRWR